MKKNLYLVLFLSLFWSNLFSQVGTSCSNPYIIYPYTSCSSNSNNCGAQYCGYMQCPNADCGTYVTMTGSSGGLNPATTSDDETTESVMWMAVTTTTTSFTINNGSPYVGGGAAAANTKDYVVYSGTCGSLSQIGSYTIGPNSSATVTGLTTGQVYYIMASPASTNTTANAISACVSSTVAYHAPGNTCATAITVGTNSSGTYTNAGATADGPICSGSVEDDVWYKWCAPASWPAGQQAFVSVTNQICNSTLGLQLSVWNTNTTCPTLSTNPTVVCQNPGSLTQYYFQWTAVANQCYYITLDGFAGTACQYRLAVGSVVVLPIELIRFDAKQNNHVVDLFWSTASEINNDYFTVEKSSDGNLFSPLVRIEGAGNSNSLLNYSTVDTHPFSGINYYRIKQTDYDGRYSYSDVIAVNFSDKQKFYSLFDISTQEINITHYCAAECKSRITIFDLSSRQVYSVIEKSDAGKNTYRVDVNQFASGVYFITLENDFETIKSKFLKE